MEVRQLRYFVTVAETRHFGRAAERLHIAQSPLSQAIRALEAHLGAPLFDRTTRRVDLTAAGEALLPEAVRILESVAAARDQVSRVAAGDLGRLRVGATGLATYRHVPDLVRRLAAELPGLDLAFTTEMLTPALEAALADHRVDLAVLRPPVRDHALATHLLARERLVLAVPVAHPLTGGPVAVAALAAEDFVVYSAPGSVVGAAAERTCRAAGFMPRHTHEADQTSIVLALVAAGRGVALLPSSVLAVAVEGVRYLDLAGLADLPDGAGAGVEVALAWRRDDPSPALEKALAVLTRDQEPL